MLQPPHLKAIAPMYATDDRYTDDVHYLGGCLTASDLAQYATSMVAMNAMPPKAEYVGSEFAELWKARLEQTPLWLAEWLRQQADGPYWRSGSLAPDYSRITCALLHFGGWSDSYRNPVLRMQEKCVNAPRKCIVGPWVHDYPDSARPGPNIDWLHEMVRFFDYWLKGVDNGFVSEPDVRLFIAEYTPPEAFPKHWNGAWRSDAAYPVEGAHSLTLYLDDEALTHRPPSIVHRRAYPHRPTWGTSGPLCTGGGGEPNGLARDLRPDEALALTFTSAPLTEPLTCIGFPQAVLHLSCSAPVATACVRLADVHPDGTSALVSFGVLNLTHRDGHADPKPLTPGEVYEVSITLNAAGYRFLPGHRLRLSLASANWPIIWPSPHNAVNTLHCGPATPSRLILPIAPESVLPPPAFKTTPPDLLTVGGGHSEPSVWRITEDVLNGSVTVSMYGGDTTLMPDGRALFADERIEMTAFHNDPAHAQLYNEETYRLTEHGYETLVRSAGTFRSTETNFHLDIQLSVHLNGQVFFQKAWLETVPRRWV
jgi:putative CocE/NonD family hydrolase